MKIKPNHSRQLWLFPQTRQFSPDGLLNFLRSAYLRTSGIDKSPVMAPDRARIKAYTADRQLLKQSTLNLLNKFEEPEDRAVIIWALGRMRHRKAGPAIMDVLKEILPRFNEGSEKVRMAAIEALKHIRYIPAFRTLINSNWRSEQETAAALEAALEIVEGHAGQILMKKKEQKNINQFAFHGNARIKQAAVEILAHMWGKQELTFGIRLPVFLDPHKPFRPTVARA
jgi:hypothetical protein